MNKKITKTIAKGTITFMVGAFVGHNFHLIKNQDTIKTDNKNLIFLIFFIKHLLI